MALLEEEDRSILKERFSQEMEREVEFRFFSRESYHRQEVIEFPAEMEGEDQDLIPQACAISYQLYQEVAALSPHLKLTFYDLDSPAGRLAADEAGLDAEMLPAMAYQAESLSGKSRFLGIPVGYEFATLIENVIDLSRDANHLSPQTQASLSALSQPAQIRVFVTPTCNFCPSAVRMAHQMAMSSPLITADIIEANEFQALAERFYVYGVPKMIINEKVEFEGAVPEKVFLAKVLAAAN
jgi:glutaredoxin-like protein